MEGASQLRQSLVKLGTYQGLFAGGSSPGAVHVYHENKDACGDYYVGDDGAPPSPDYAYYDNWDGNSYSVITCINGTHHSAYQFLYRKGTVTSTPFSMGRSRHLMDWRWRRLNCRAILLKTSIGSAAPLPIHAPIPAIDCICSTVRPGPYGMARPRVLRRTHHG